MLQNYKGSYYKGSNVGLRQFKQKPSKPVYQQQKNSWVGVFLVVASIFTLVSFCYLNRKETKKGKRDNINDTIELIQGIAKTNLEHDIAQSQSAYTARNASIRDRNPAQLREMELERQKAITIETKRRNDYMAKQNALDYNTPNVVVNNTNMKQTHSQYHYPDQPLKGDTYNVVLPVDKSREQQTQMMYNAQFNNVNNSNKNTHMSHLNNEYKKKPYQTINSPFVHPEETIRPVLPSPVQVNNTLETGNRPDLFLENVPSNVFDSGFFSVNESYESPFLAKATGVSKYGQPITPQNVSCCTNNSNINQSGNPNIQGYTNNGFSNF